MKHRLTWLCTLFALSFVLTACGGAAAPAAGAGDEPVQSITLKRDDGGEPGETVTSFTPGDRVMHFVIQFGNIQLNTKMSADLIAVDAGGEKNLSVVKKDMDALAANTFTFTASLPQDWPAGQYKLDVYLADKLVKSHPFTVQ